MPNKYFTYLIGAGASANVVPIVKSFTKRMYEQLNYLQDQQLFKEANNENTLIYIRDLFWLISESENHASIDTFARKLYLTNQLDDLKKLKALIDAFLTEIQTTDKLDVRYDAFFATLFEGGDGKDISLPDNVTILSWNYDFQIELSLANFLTTKTIKALEEKFKFIPNALSDYNITKEFSIAKLNGTASALSTDKNFTRKNFFDLIYGYKRNKDEEYNPIEEKQQIVIKLINNYVATIKDTDRSSSIMFAWEKNDLTYRVREYAKNKTRDTFILTVIGYSFPTFNRNIDKDLLNNMPHLIKIVLQGKQADLESMEYKVRSLLPSGRDRSIKFEKIAATDEFFIPFEL